MAYFSRSFSFYVNGDRRYFHVKCIIRRCCIWGWCDESISSYCDFGIRSHRERRAIVVSQYLGSKRFMEASKISALAVTLNLIVGLVISAGFLLFSKHMMLAMNLQGDVLTYAQNYLSIVGGAIFLQAIINSLAAIIRVHGFTKQAMFISLGMNMIHIAGNYVLIFGKFGFPELGVQGAISSAISRLIALIVFFWLLYRVMEYRVKLKYYFTLSKEYIGKILKLAFHLHLNK